MKNHKVCIDSNALSYLVDAMTSGIKPTGNEADEKLALLHAYLYRNDILYISPTVRIEYERIRDEKKRINHQEVADILLGEILLSDNDIVQSKTLEYCKFHLGKNNEKDCRILAEAELGGCKIILTYDQDFIKKLHDKTHGIRIMKPSDFWHSLDIPKKSRPVTVPHHTNPLSKETWWTW